LPSDPSRSRPAPLAVAGTLRAVMTRIDGRAAARRMAVTCLRYCAIRRDPPVSATGTAGSRCYVLNRTLEERGMLSQPCGPDDDQGFGLAQSVEARASSRHIRGLAE
jgi:hypothetical protein